MDEDGWKVLSKTLFLNSSPGIRLGVDFVSKLSQELRDRLQQMTTVFGL